jgi:pyridoxal phosphate enzyme (YggS family)
MVIDNLKSVIEEIKNGNNLGEEIILVGATKMVDADTINLATKNGLKIVAENRVQEFREKTDLIKDADQHFIGHLQTNKVKYLVGNVSLIQSVDSIHLAEEIDKCASKKGVVQDILIEINVGGELSKSGFTLDNALLSERTLSEYPNIRCVGFMGMLPKSDDQEYLTDLCKVMRKIYDDAKKVNPNIKYLSMGMSGDYKITIKNGSNMIRLGSTIFGKRNYEVK